MKPHSKKDAKCKKYECLLPHCDNSTIGSCDQPFPYAYIGTLSCSTIECATEHKKGPQGNVGPFGPQGLHGKHGVEGPRGWQGTIGRKGPQGLHGFQGRHGCRGFQGRCKKGPQGPAGSEKGPQGPNGTQGFPGDNGENGENGMDGVQGPIGERGDPGGPQGFNGSQGLQGPSDGPMGPQGPEGPPGNNEGDGTLLRFGTNENENLEANEVFIHTPTGDFLQHAEHAFMSWNQILDDSNEVGGHIYAACLNLNAVLQFVIRFTNFTGRSIFVSTNGGITFNPVDAARAWNAIACSDLGGIVMATASSDFIYVSTNSGSTFSPRSIAALWQNVCMSGDGAVAMACTDGGQIYTSEDTGVTWVPRDSNRAWVKIACSSDGTIGFACTNTEMYLSIDTGHTWSLVGPVLTLVSVGMSGDASVLFAITDLGACYFSTNLGVSFALERLDVVDAALSFGQERELFLNTNNTSSYSQDAGGFFIDTVQALGFADPVDMTVDGNFALAITADRKGLMFGVTNPGNILKFNSLVSDEAVTAKLLTGLVDLPGRLDPTDSILQGFGKLLSQEATPLGITVYSLAGSVASVDLPQNVPIFVGFLAPVFQALPDGRGFIFNDTSGEVIFATPTVKEFVVDVTFSVRSFTSTTDVLFGVNNANGPHCRISLTTGWQVGHVQLAASLFFNSPNQLIALQTNSAPDVNIVVTAITYNLFPK